MKLAVLIVASGHSGIAHPKTHPLLSDLALFACAALAVWLMRRAMRARFARKATRKD